MLAVELSQRSEPEPVQQNEFSSKVEQETTLDLEGEDSSVIPLDFHIRNLSISLI